MRPQGEPKPKPYVPPSLTVHGDVGVVTQAVMGTSKTFDGSTHPVKNKTS
jgi:hypothetical protein